MRGSKGMFKLFNEQEVIGRRFQKSHLMTSLMARSHINQISSNAEENVDYLEEYEEEDQVGADDGRRENGVQPPHEAEQEAEEDRLY